MSQERQERSKTLKRKSRSQGRTGLVRRLLDDAVEGDGDSGKGVAVERSGWYMLAPVAEGTLGERWVWLSGEVVPLQDKKVSPPWHSANTPPAWCLESSSGECGAAGTKFPW